MSPSAAIQRPRNRNYETYLGTALQLQRWRDFGAHATAYVVVNALLVVLWAARGGGAFWPAVSLVSWGLGLSSQHFANSWRSPITHGDVCRQLGPCASSEGLADVIVAESSRGTEEVRRAG